MDSRRLDSFCSRTSLELREQIFGTASTGKAWLLLEYNGPWTHNLLADSDLPGDAKRVLAATLDGNPDARLLFIKNDLRGKAGLSFFVAVAREQHQALYRFELDDYRDLLSIDVAGLANGMAADEVHAVDAPLYLVCVDGKHDKCCAKFGLPIYRELVRAAGLTVWQSSHVGGDRFAANVVCLPSGVYYGRVEPNEADRIVRDTAAGYIYLGKFRGRSCYGFAAQAAEYFARMASGLQQLGALTVRDVSRTDGLIHVELREPATDRDHLVSIVRTYAGRRRYLTCSAETELDVPRYELRTYRVQQGAACRSARSDTPRDDAGASG